MHKLTDFDARGLLTKLTCWHRLTEEESNDLVKLFIEHTPDAGKMVDAAQSVYGYCPICHAKGATRERRPNGYDGCVNGHIYPSSRSVGSTQPNHIPDAGERKPLTDEEIRKMWHKEHKWHKERKLYKEHKWRKSLLSPFEWYMAGVKAAIKERS